MAVRILTVCLFLGVLSACGEPAAPTFRFPAISYSPYHGNLGSCPSAEAIQADFAKMRNLAPMVRTYGLRDCNQGESAMAAATALGMHVNLGLWLEPLPGDANGVQPAAAELQVLGRLLTTYGPDAISIITVGNETQQTTAVPSSDVVSSITQVRTLLAAQGANIPVTTAQVATAYTPDLVAAVDFLLPNIHPYWAGQDEPAAAEWVVTTAQSLAASSGKPVMLGETGWPTAGPEDANAVASADNETAYIRDIVCTAQDANLDYTYFEGFDVNPGAGAAEVEAHWGVMDGDGNLKTEIPRSIGCNSTSTRGW